MRAILKLKFEKPLVLPIHYNHILQAAILNLLSDENYSKFIHDLGFQFEKRHFKMFTFSRLEGNFSINKENKTITYFNEANLQISTVEEEFMKYVINNLLLNEGIELKGNRLQVEKVELRHMDVEDGGRIVTKSPIVAYSTFEIEGRKKTYYYNPKEKEFEEILRKNLIKKYTAYFGKEPRGKHFKIIPIANLKESIVIYKGTVIKGWN
ncbi:MAG: CRISPR-associated endoribonuclease Cas6, partial [Caloramator sp.]|nr:CRISPR-associated endoribonuclease Cas6 [Caloramator sp.]